MFLDMKVLYTVQRGLAQLSKFNGNPKYPAAVTVRDVLEFATIRGAECNALDRKCGSLTPGKEADLLMIRTDTVRHTPLNNAFGAIVHASTRADLDAVFIAGQAKKWRGQMTNKLVAQDFNKVRQLAEETRQYVLAKANCPLDIFSDYSSIRPRRRALKRFSSSIFPPRYRTLAGQHLDRHSFSLC
jgi:5-methylthioadenosine/S-adenosylhomocysteine deaminase